MNLRLVSVSAVFLLTLFSIGCGDPITYKPDPELLEASEQCKTGGNFTVDSLKKATGLDANNSAYPITFISDFPYPIPTYAAGFSDTGEKTQFDLGEVRYNGNNPNQLGGPFNREIYEIMYNQQWTLTEDVRDDVNDRFGIEGEAASSVMVERDLSFGDTYSGITKKAATEGGLDGAYTCAAETLTFVNEMLKNSTVKNLLMNNNTRHLIVSETIQDVPTKCKKLGVGLGSMDVMGETIRRLSIDVLHGIGGVCPTANEYIRMASGIISIDLQKELANTIVDEALIQSAMFNADKSLDGVKALADSIAHQLQP